MNQKTTGIKFPMKIRIKSAFTPKIVDSWIHYRHEKKDIEKDVSLSLVQKDEKIAQAKKKLKKKIGISLLKTAGAFAFYQACGMTYGVDARDYNLNFSAQEAWGNTSKPSLAVAHFLSTLIPENKKGVVASVIIPVEMGLSVVRIYVEQKVWKKYGITPDPAGTLLTPYMAGAIEFAYKLTTTYPQDDNARIGVGLVGIYGNFVRMANAGLIYAIGKLIVKEKPTA